MLDENFFGSLLTTAARFLAQGEYPPAIKLCRQGHQELCGGEREHIDTQRRIGGLLRLVWGTGVLLSGNPYEAAVLLQAAHDDLEPVKNLYDPLLMAHTQRNYALAVLVAYRDAPGRTTELHGIIQVVTNALRIYVQARRLLEAAVCRAIRGELYARRLDFQSARNDATLALRILAELAKLEPPPETAGLGVLCELLATAADQAAAVPDRVNVYTCDDLGELMKGIA